MTDWFRRGHIPDETYFHTVLRHDKDLVVSTDVVSYVPTGPNRPTVRWMVLKLEELPAVWRSGAAFARKVDPAERPEVIRALNAEVDRRRAAGPGPDHHHPQKPAPTPLPPSAENESPRDPPACVAVVGMHRSGTSATAGLLVGLGLTPPKLDDLFPAEQSNERGHWESRAVILHSLKVMGTLGGRTYSPPPPTSGWEVRPEFDSLRAEAARVARRHVGREAGGLEGPSAVHDPSGLEDGGLGPDPGPLRAARPLGGRSLAAGSRRSSDALQPGAMGSVRPLCGIEPRGFPDPGRRLRRDRWKIRSSGAT